MPSPPDSNPDIGFQVASPATRDIRELLKAIDVVAKELDFQISRLSTTVIARNSEEARYHDTLKGGYKNAAYWIRDLGRYQEKRLAEQQPQTDPYL